MKQGMVEKVEGPHEEETPAALNRLSSLGRGVLSQEITRLEDVVQEGMRLRSNPGGPDAAMAIYRIHMASPGAVPPAIWR